MSTRVNRLKIAASNPLVTIRLVTGHGILINSFPRVPKDTYIIFLTSPGQCTPVSTWSNPHLRNESFVRGVLTRTIPVKNALQTMPLLARWPQQFYAPGDVYPDLSIEFSDPNRRPVGVRNIRTGSLSRRGTSATIQGILNNYGPGIYIIASCRPSISRLSKAVSVFETIPVSRRVSGTMPRLPPMRVSDPFLNRLAQLIEQKQKRYVKHKRLRSGQSPNQKSPPKKMTQIKSVLRARFHPGTGSKTLRARKLRTRARIQARASMMNIDS